jgi:lipopolysaccharide transport system ATP-binding protein
MGDTILKVENVSKQYRLGTYGTKTIGGDVHRWWTTKVLGKEDPFLKVGQVNDRTSKEKADFVWALRDINFEVKRGEVLGIIGKNGAGKSTLLKLLSRITSPTTGSIESWGRMASLLEVGTGFHPELTGRENIFLNGAILGMTKAEIRRKLDEIIDFSGCALYIDTPVKRYSSGMTVRLGFAVAAFLDPEILIVDEVLAVGDAEFQKKAIGKMQDISKGEGRTVLFVSHNLQAVNDLCGRCVLFENGRLVQSGKTNNIIQKYLFNMPEKTGFQNIKCKQEVELKSFEILECIHKSVLNVQEKCHIRIVFFTPKKLNNLVLGLNIFSEFGQPLVRLTYDDYFDSKPIDPGTHEIIFKIPENTLAEGSYRIQLDFAIAFVQNLLSEDLNLTLKIKSINGLGNKFTTKKSKNHESIVRPNWLHSFEKIK